MKRQICFYAIKEAHCLLCTPLNSIGDFDLEVFLLLDFYAGSIPFINADLLALLVRVLHYSCIGMMIWVHVYVTATARKNRGLPCTVERARLFLMISSASHIINEFLWFLIILIFATNNSWVCSTDCHLSSNNSICHLSLVLKTAFGVSLRKLDDAVLYYDGAVASIVLLLLMLTVFDFLLGSSILLLRVVICAHIFVSNAHW